MVNLSSTVMAAEKIVISVFPDWAIGILLAFGGCALSNFGITMFKLAQLKLIKEEEEIEFQKSNTIEKKDNVSKAFCHPVWLLGMCCCILGSLLDFVSFAFASVSLLAPMGALTLLLNMVMAPVFLNEKLTLWDFGCTLFILIGTIVAIVFGNKNNASYALSDLLKLYTEISFIVFLILAAVVCSVFVIFLYQAVRRLATPGDYTQAQLNMAYRYILIAYPTLAGLAGAFSVLFAKSIVEMIKSAGNGHSKDLANPFFFLFLAAIIVSIYLQVFMLNLGLEKGDALFVVPVYQVSWVLNSTLLGLIYFRDLWAMTVLNVCLFILGVLITLFAIYLLSLRVSSHPSELNSQTYSNLSKDHDEAANGFYHHKQMFHNHKHAEALPEIKLDTEIAVDNDDTSKLYT